MFLSWSRSRDTGWSTIVKMHPSFSNWSSSRFCCSLRAFCSGPMALYARRPIKESMMKPHICTSDLLLVKFRLTTGRQTIPSCFSLSLWSAGIRQTGTDKRLLASCSLGVNRRKMVWDFFSCSNLQSAELVKRVAVMSAPVSTSFPSCSRPLWEMRFSRVTAFKRCFRFWKTSRHSGKEKTLSPFG